MVRLVEEKRDDIALLCRRYAVRRLELFGSAAGADFDAETSDLDFLVEFQPLKPGEYADAYFGLLEGLQQLFGRPVDLVMPRAVKNPYFLEAMNQSPALLYNRREGIEVPELVV
jgi:predicted nucleotidyltransferase